MRLFVSLLTCMVLVSCGDDDADLNEDGGAAGFGGSDPGDGDGDGDPEADGGGRDDDGGLGCSKDDDCSDGINCTGVERCEAGNCEPGVPPACTEQHACVEATGECECSNPNLDGDGFDAIPCGGEDCNDLDPDIHPGADEICPAGGDDVDEDCRPATFHNEATNDGDADGDGQVSVSCVNRKPDGQPFRGTDCDDRDEATYEGADEQCDYADNDCDGEVDERRDGDDPAVPRGLQISFYPDEDHDGYGNREAAPIERCESYPPPNYVPADRPHDCDDNNIDVNIAETELCDGFDNDCDDLTDEEDNNSQPLLKPEFTDTDVRCRVPEGKTEPELVIADCPGDLGEPEQLLWCGTPVVFGCTIDGTTLENCRECDNACSFACGREDCEEVDALSVSVEHSCATTTDGNVACWGRGALGRLGDDAGRGSSVPSQVVALRDAIKVVAGPVSSCAVLGDSRELHCWGDNTYRQLGNGDPGDGFSAVPLPVLGAYSSSLTDVAEVAIGDRHACAIVENELFCWGSEETGRLGNAYDSDARVTRPAPVERTGGETVVDAEKVAVGTLHGCLVTTAGAVECWGDNSYGQLGDPEFTESLSAIARPVPGLTGVDDIAASYLHTCALRAGEVLCWGANDRSQLGRAPGTNDGAPMAVAGLSGVVAIDAALTFTCALDAQGIVSCWGSNDVGERGDAEPEDSAAPTPIDVEGIVQSFSVDGLHGCARSESNVTYCWGLNNFGQLGLGLGAQQSEPTPTSIKPLVRAR